MKKIITIILFFFLSIFMCYLIYNLTETNNLKYLVIGNNISKNNQIITKNKTISYNNYYTNDNYRIKDIINIMKYNEEMTIDNKKISIHRLIKESDIIIIYIGMNDIYYKISDDTKNIYTYLNSMVSDMETILTTINKYHPTKIIVLGYYNITNKNNDLFNYLNYKMKKITNKNNTTYIDLNKYLKNDPTILSKKDYFSLNTNGYNKLNQLIVDSLEKT